MPGLDPGICRTARVGPGWPGSSPAMTAWDEAAFSLAPPAPACRAARRCPRPSRTPARPTRRWHCSRRPAAPAAVRRPAGRRYLRRCSRSPSKSMTLTSAFMPGCSRPRSWKPKKSAVSLVCRLTTNSSGRRGPRVRSRTQWRQHPVSATRRRRSGAMRAAVPTGRARRAGPSAWSRMTSWSPCM